MPEGPQGPKRPFKYVRDTCMLEKRVHMIALYTTWYNFARINSAVRMSLAMAASLEARP